MQEESFVNKNNKQRKSTLKIEEAFIQLIQDNDLNKITVSKICEITNLNRSTFYANYLDVYDLADKVCENIEDEFVNLFKDGDLLQNGGRKNDGIKMFYHIYENQLSYKTYFKLIGNRSKSILTNQSAKNEKNFDDGCADYHVEFFKSGLNAVIIKWLNGGCKETPEEMYRVIESEYRLRFESEE